MTARPSRSGSGRRWAVVPIAVWAVYIGLGWAVAPGTCSTPVLLHGISGLMVAIGLAGVVLAYSSLRGTEGEGDDEAAASGFTVRVGLMLGVLFLAGTVLAWILAGLWCP